jgi:hypothetical protein
MKSYHAFGVILTNGKSFEGCIEHQDEAKVVLRINIGTEKETIVSLYNHSILLVEDLGWRRIIPVSIKSNGKIVKNHS